MRTFETGATRDSEEEKLDYEGFLSPLALEAYARYMHKHRTQADGSLRDSDNWQKGIPLSSYMKSLWRHMIALWTLHRAGKGDSGAFDEALGGIIFNAFGYWHMRLQGEESLEKALEPFREKSFAGESDSCGGNVHKPYAKEVAEAAEAIEKAQQAQVPIHQRMAEVRD